MERTRKRGLKKSGDYVEVAFSGEEIYDTYVNKVINALAWDYDPEEGSPYLCRLNGCRVVERPVTVDGVAVPWTISRYLHSVFSSISHVKLGVALFQVYI